MEINILDLFPRKLSLRDKLTVNQKIFDKNRKIAEKLNSKL